MDHWHSPYLGIRSIPPELNDFELNTFFTFSKKERQVIDGRRQGLYRLAMALHIGFLRMSGRALDAYKQIPRQLWNHLGTHLGVDAPDISTLRALYDERPRTLIDHQQLAYQTLGFEEMRENQRRYVVRWIKEFLTGRPDTSSLLVQVKKWLYEHAILIPHDRELKRLIVSAVNGHEEGLEATLIDDLGPNLIDHWAKELPKPDDEHASLQHWLWAVPLRHSTIQMKELFAKLDRLADLKVVRPWPDRLNEALVRYYARRCANRPPSISKRIKARGRRLETACFMRYSLCTTTDQLLEMFRRWLKDLRNDAARQVDAGRPDDRKLLNEFVDAVAACVEDKSLQPSDAMGKITELVKDVRERKPPSRSSLIRLQLMAKGAQARAMLAKLVQLPFESESQHPVIDGIDLLRKIYSSPGKNELPETVDIKLGRAWRELIAGEDRVNALYAFEWAILFALRMALRNGSVFVNHSFSHRSRATLLIPKEEWEAKRKIYCGAMGTPMTAKEFLAPKIEQLDLGLDQLRKACLLGDIRIDAAGVHTTPIVATKEEKHLDVLRRGLFDARPLGQLPEIILQIDSQVRFSWLLLGREPRSRSELLLIYAAVLAHGTSLSAADIARMIPELASADVRKMMKRVADERKLREASDAVLQFMHRHPIAAHWGRGDLASSDMMSLETTRSVWQARADPRRRTASIGIYSHKKDGWGIIHDQPILLKERPPVSE